jgi:excisionase family DNA binding protein
LRRAKLRRKKMTDYSAENGFPEGQDFQIEARPKGRKPAVSPGKKGKKDPSNQKDSDGSMPSVPAGKRLYTLKEAARYLGRSEWGMRDLIWAGKIPVVRDEGGRKIFIDVYDLVAYVERNKAAYY